MAPPRIADPLHGLLGTFMLCLAVLAAGLAAIYQVTAGGAAFTTETLRRTAVAQAPMAVPDYSVVDAQGNVHGLRGLIGQQSQQGPGMPVGRVLIIDFVYTRCVTLCLALGTVFQQLQAQIIEQGLQAQVGLLSISFDPMQDQPPALAAYAQRMRMQPGVWQVVSLRNETDRRKLLDSFGIMVVPAPLGEFEHNAALHVVSPAGWLVRIVGLDESGVALELAREMADELASELARNVSHKVSHKVSHNVANDVAGDLAHDAAPGLPRALAFQPARAP